MEIEKRDLEAVYDKLCKVLTEYESGNANTGELYNTIIDAANDLEAILY